MKLVCAILSMLVTVLTYTPSCAGDNCPVTELSQACDTNSSQDKGHNGACSPFFTCCACSGFSPMRYVVDVSPAVLFIDKQYMLFNNIYTNGYHSDFWQPPKVS